MSGPLLTPDLPQAHFNSKHLFFRPLTVHDKAMYFSLYTNEQVMRHIGPPLSQEQVETLFSYTLKRTNGRGHLRLSWALVARRSGKCIGIVALTWDLALKGAASIGVMLVSEEQGKGYGLEAQGALAEYGFTSLGLVRIHSQFAVNNSANERIYHKLGFIAEDHKAGLANNTLPTKFCYLDKQGWQRSFIKNFPG